MKVSLALSKVHYTTRNQAFKALSGSILTSLVLHTPISHISNRKIKSYSLEYKSKVYFPETHPPPLPTWARLLDTVYLKGSNNPGSL